MFESLFGSFDTDSLFDEFRRVENQMEQLFSSSAWPAGIRAVQRGTFPPVNVGATPEQIHVYVFAPGIDPKTLDVSIQQSLLTVSGSREIERDESADYYRQERYDGEFRRVVALPEDVDTDRIDATYRNGVLHIAVQRRESARPRQITIN